MLLHLVGFLLILSHNLFNGVNEFLHILAQFAAGLVAVGLEDLLQCPGATDCFATIDTVRSVIYIKT